MPESVGFLEWYGRHATGFIPDQWNFNDTKKLTHVGSEGFGVEGEDIWIWKPGTKKQRSLDVGPFFPFDNGGEPPYWRQRTGAEDYEVGQFFRYQNWCKRNGIKAGPFEPIPLPTPEELGDDDED